MGLRKGIRRLLDRVPVPAFLRRRTVERELDDELRFHLERAVERNRSRGMEPEAARRAARRTFGGVEQVKEACRDEWPGSTLDGLVRDVRYGLRSLRKTPGYTAVVIVILALGIGANTAVFSLVHGVLLRPLPYPGSDELVVLGQTAPGAGVEDLDFSVAEIADYRKQTESLELAEYHMMTFTLLGRERPERVSTGVVSADFFDLLGVEPILGRSFRPDDEAPGAEPVLILGHDYWRRGFGSDADVVGRVFEMNDRPHRVIGVLPPLPHYPAEQEVYMPTSACPYRAAAQERMREDRNAGRMMGLVGRLTPGASLERARTEVDTVAERFEREYPDNYAEDLSFGASVTGLHETLTRDARPLLALLLATTALVLLIACANLANLSLARSRRRERELVARAALGASRGRLVRQLLVESTLLGVVGGAAGMVVAYLGLGALTELIARFTPRAAEIALDGWVLAFSLLLSVATGLVFGLMALPPRFDLARALRTDSSRGSIGTRRRGLRGALVVGQVALALVLLAGAGLMIRSFVGLQRVELGFDPERVLTAEISLNWSKYSSIEGDLTTEEAAALTRGFWHELLERLNGHPEVVAAATADRFPFAPTGNPFLQEVTVEGRGEGPEAVEPRADLREVSPGYLEALGIPVLQGRSLSARDHAEAPPVALVSRSTAERFWGEWDPVGRRLSTDDGTTWVTVVGVVGDTRGYGADDRVYPTIYRPMDQAGGAFRLIARTRGSPTGLAADLERLVYSVDPDQPVAEIRPLDEIVAESIASPRLTALLLGLFAAVAVVIAVTGIAGALAFAVGQRTRELSLRMALGARPGEVAWLVVRRGLLQVALGIVLGLVVALALGRFFESLLFDLEPTDPATLVTVAAVLLVAAGAACWIPARRATEIPPARTLQA